jgi:hypothetical protein
MQSGKKFYANNIPSVYTAGNRLFYEAPFMTITRNMGQDGDGHAHFDQIWRPNITINYTGVDQNIKF